MKRRQFLGVGALGSAATLAFPHAALAQQSPSAQPLSDPATDRTVTLTGDGVPHSPAQYAHLLAQLTERQGGVAADNYILGGVVEELEARFAQILGKEAAVFIPTGTLANHLAIRTLCGNAPARAIVQSESHLYQDCGDTLQTLSNINLVPLAPGKATFTAADVQQLVDQGRTGRVSTRIAAMQIESPVRRRTGEVFDRAELAKVIEVARTNNIRLHLDGARMFIEAAYANKPIAEYTAPFETVYVSLYKYFNAASGAILAGPRELLKDMFHTRRMFGGGLYQAWPFAAVALHYADGFVERFQKSIPVAESLLTALGRMEGVTIGRIQQGTNLFGLRVPAAKAAPMRERLAREGIRLGAPNQNGQFTVAVNETLAWRTAPELIDAFTKALS